MKTIQLTVAGEGDDKKAIAEFLAKCLNQVGLEATIEDKVGLLVSDDAAAERAAEFEKTFQARLKAIVHGDDFTRVEIRTEDLKRIALS